MKRRNVKSFSILLVLFMVISMVSAGLPLTVNATEGTPGEPAAPRGQETYTMNVSFDLKGGDWKPGEKIAPYPLTEERGTDVNPDLYKGKGISPLKEGYTFVGWNVRLEDMTGGTLIETSIWAFGYSGIRDPNGELPDESNLIFTAVWKQQTDIKSNAVMHVNHDLDGGAWKPGEEIDNYDIPFRKGEYIPASKFLHESRTPEREGYTFASWKYKLTGAEGAGSIEGGWPTGMGWPTLTNDPDKSTMLLTAVWKRADAPETYTAHIIYDLKGGDWKDGEKIDPYDITKNRGEDIEPSEFKGKGTVPVKEGYTFVGWTFHMELMDGTVRQTSGDDLWIFDEYDYEYGENTPSEFKIIFTAVWDSAKTPKEEPTKAEPGKVIPKTPKTPKTGDNSPLALATLLLISAGAATIGVTRKSYLNK
ncbi:MAG: InlB B-repeat-containing protein [Anaerovoracaceae bacterium]